jgi:selT/selW/selH-like putative selenoprotein
VEAEVKESYPDASIELIQGSGGVFDVTCDGEMIYSKQNIQGKPFPSEGEIVGLIRRKAG